MLSLFYLQFTESVLRRPLTKKYAKLSVKDFSSQISYKIMLCNTNLFFTLLVSCTFLISVLKICGTVSVETRNSDDSFEENQNPATADPRIVGGYRPSPDIAKYQVSVRVEAVDRPFGNGHICGGTLIGPKLVVTAAHCLFTPKTNILRRHSEFRIVMGSHIITSNGELTIVRKVKSMVVHRSYNSDTLSGDIALLKVIFYIFS